MSYDRDKVRAAMLLYGITDRYWTSEKVTLKDQVREAMEGGITCLQIREKHLGDKEFLAEALDMKDLCKAYNVPLIINDNVDVALACDADGVHVGQSDEGAAHVRARIGKDKILGVSCGTVEQALKAQAEGADYLGVGTMFTTTSKDDAERVSMDTLRDICQAVDIPVVAIGGIKDNNIMELAGTGIDGVSIISGIFGAPDITGECRLLKKLSQEMIFKGRRIPC